MTNHEAADVFTRVILDRGRALLVVRGILVDGAWSPRVTAFWRPRGWLRVVAMVLALTGCGDNAQPTLGDYAETWADAAAEWSASCNGNPQQAHDHVVWFVCDHYGRENDYSCDAPPTCEPNMDQCVEDVLAMPCLYPEGHFEWPASCWPLTRGGCD